MVATFLSAVVPTYMLRKFIFYTPIAIHVHTNVNENFLRSVYKINYRAISVVPLTIYI